MDEHEQFVSSEHGCEQYEVGVIFAAPLKVFIALSVAPFAILLRNLVLPWMFLGRKFPRNGSGLDVKFFLDFSIIVLPVLLSLSIFASSILFIILILLLCIIVLIIFVLFEYQAFNKERPLMKGLWQKMIEDHHQPTTFFTYLRGMVLIFTSIAILAVDFHVFPRRYAKTTRFGHSLMDVGVSAFVFILAVASQLKRHRPHDFKDDRPSSSTVILVLLGLMRTIFVKILHYPESVTEYGVHWNFFYTFCIVQDWALSDEAPRDTFIAANREGICSLLGYISLYFLASAIGKFIASTGCRVRNWIICAGQLLFLAAFLLVAQKGAEMGLGPPSRRIANAPYILSQLCVLTYSLAICMIVQMVTLVGWAAEAPHFGNEENPWCGLQPCMLDAVNRAGLAVFLVANVLTGLINVTITTTNIDDVSATAILAVYILICCGFASVAAARKNSE